MKTISRFYFTVDESHIDLNELVNHGEISEKLIQLIKLKFGDCWAIYNDVEVAPWEFEGATISEPSAESVERWKNRFKYIYISTFDKYNRLIELYRANENNLMNKLSSSTTTKFNDTPQNANIGDTDEYTSTFTKVSSEVDPGEIINRLHNIKNQYDNLYKDWVNEFSVMFGEK